MGQMSHGLERQFVSTQAIYPTPVKVTNQDREISIVSVT
jgi:hypothetical protein